MWCHGRTSLLRIARLFDEHELSKKARGDLVEVRVFDDTNKKYVIFEDPNDELGEVFAYSYDDEGNLSAIETDEEWEMVEEVLGAFSEENL